MKLSECVEKNFTAHHPEGYQYDPYFKRVVDFICPDNGDWQVRVTSPIYFYLLPQDGWIREVPRP